MAKIHRTTKFCTHVLHMEGEEVFGSQKHKPNMSLGNEQQSHRPDRVNFTYPQAEIRSLELELLVVL
jgi:hypothetical protein